MEKNEISPQALHQRMVNGENIALVDVRTGLEFATGHIPGATNVPLQKIAQRSFEDHGSDLIIMVCQSGHRSALACQQLSRDLGSVLNLAGGMAAWRSAGLPIERPPVTSRSIERQTHLVAAMLLITALYLANTVSPQWFWLAALPAFGLSLDALTGICPMTMILRAMPWNKRVAT